MPPHRRAGVTTRSARRFMGSKVSVAGFSNWGLWKASCLPNGRLFHMNGLPLVSRGVAPIWLSYGRGNGVLGSGGAERPEEQPESGAR